MEDEEEKFIDYIKDWQLGTSDMLYLWKSKNGEYFLEHRSQKQLRTLFISKPSGTVGYHAGHWKAIWKEYFEK